MIGTHHADHILKGKSFDFHDGKHHTFTDKDYPSGPWHDRFFRIGAADADGKVFNWTPEDGITYVLPGIDVPSESDAALSERAESPETGSSVATALGAGLVAMIIYCLKATILTKLWIPPDDAPARIARPDEMKRAFAVLGKPTASKFITVWEELDKIGEQLEAYLDNNASQEDKMKSTRAFVVFGLNLWNASKQDRRDVN
ncbi:hypothetical protein C8A05DRAFT_31550 [Staphylotrichum tortipilum]|uniref:Peptidase S8/S53 domain-containing protein n=1 Tax=Staphylotrichum tortipilum TaxID=2831512 RepID=A0AAN6MPW6_9PEZI|nr:hypothetical protein C8A05DRAFT_31550 [Staphylotrichum longicolle]